VFGLRHRATIMALHAVPPSSATQLSYRTTNTDDSISISDTDMNEVVLSTILHGEKPDSLSPLATFQIGLEEIEQSLIQSPSVMSWLTHFKVIEQAGRVTYPHMLQTVNTWGFKKHIRRRVKFIEMLNPVQSESLESLFRIVDRDNDGLVDMFDFRSVLDSVKVEDEVDVDPDEEDVDPTSEPRLGLNGFKKMTSKEFIGLAAEAEFYYLLTETFNEMDTEGNGYVRVDDVSDLLHGLKSMCTSFDCGSRFIEFISGNSDADEEKVHRYVFYKDFIASLLEMPC